MKYDGTNPLNSTSRVRTSSPVRQRRIRDADELPTPDHPLQYGPCVILQIKPMVSARMWPQWRRHEISYGVTDPRMLLPAGLRYRT
jgi:hypothetical protein